MCVCGEGEGGLELWGCCDVCCILCISVCARVLMHMLVSATMAVCLSVCLSVRWLVCFLLMRMPQENHSTDPENRTDWGSSSLHISDWYREFPDSGACGLLSTGGKTPATSFARLVPPLC